MQGRRALVAGGAGLLGSEIAATLAELGARVVIASRNEEHCRERAAEIGERFQGSELHGAELDITDRASVDACIERVGELLGGLDILVACSWSGRKNTLDSIDEEDWLADIEVSLNGVFRLVKAALPLLRVRPGVILTIGSMYGHVAPDPGLYDSTSLANPPSYGAAKAGVIQLTRYLATFLGAEGVRVNCISPGPFPYESTQEEHPDFIARLGAKNPLGRIGKPWELKGAAAFLCSDASTYVTGQNVCVDGGWTVW